MRKIAPRVETAAKKQLQGYIGTTLQILLLPIHALQNVFEADHTIKLRDVDSTGNQTNNLNNFLTKDVNYLVLNNNNTGANSDQLKEADSYVIFANVDNPQDEDFDKNDKLYLVTFNTSNRNQYRRSFCGILECLSGSGQKRQW